MDNRMDLPQDPPATAGQVADPLKKKANGVTGLAGGPHDEASSGTGAGLHVEAAAAADKLHRVVADGPWRKVLDSAVSSGVAAVEHARRHPVQLAINLIGLALMVASLRRARSR